MQKPAAHTSQHAVTAAFCLGDETAFDTVFHDLYPALCYYGFRITGNRAAAEDIAITSFLKTWQKRLLFREWTALKSYLYTAVRHGAIDWLKKEERQCLAAQESLVTVPLLQPSILDQLIATEVLHEIYHAMERLPAQCRKVMELIYIHGKSSREAAKVLRLSVSSIRNQKARGLGLLRKMVQLCLVLTGLLPLPW